MPHLFLRLVEEVRLKASKLGEVHLDAGRLGGIIARQVETLLGQGTLTIYESRATVKAPKLDNRSRFSQFRTSCSGWKPEHELGPELEISVLARGGGRVERKQLRVHVPQRSFLPIEGRLGMHRVIATLFPFRDNYGGGDLQQDRRRRARVPAGHEPPRAPGDEAGGGEAPHLYPALLLAQAGHAV